MIKNILTLTLPSIMSLLILIFYNAAQANYTILDVIPVGNVLQDVDINKNTNIVYVSSFNDHTVYVIDGSNNELITAIPVGHYPRSVGVNSNTNRIYVTNFGSDSVSVINGDNNVVISEIAIGDAPAGIGVDPKINRIYAANDPDGTVSVIDGSSNTVIATIPVDSWPRPLSVNPITGRVYVVNANSDTVSVIDGYSNTVIDTITVGPWPGGVAVNQTTNIIYVTNIWGNNLSVIDGTNNAVITNIPVGDYPVGVAVDHLANLIYVTLEALGGEGAVTVIDGTSNKVVETIPVGRDLPGGIDVNTLTKKIYVTSGDDAVYVLSPETLTIQTEDYDQGGQQVAYFDRTPGNAGGQYRQDDVDIWRSGPDKYYTGANSTGEWLNYTIDVPYRGDYRLDIRVATPNSNRRVHVEFDGLDKTGPLTVPNTGWWTYWETLSANVTLSAGRQAMRLVIDNGGLNIDQIALVSSGDLSSVATPTIKPNGGSFTDSVKVTLISATANAAVYYTTDGSDPYTSASRRAYSSPFTLMEDTTVRAYAEKAGMSDSDEAIADFIKDNANISVITIQAEDYDQGGQQVAYFDRTPGNAGGQYRQDDVDIWRSGPDKYYTGGNATGEWLNYTIDVPYSGDYRLDIRVATPNNNRRLHVEFDGLDKTGPLTVPNTGWWASWKTLHANITLSAGRQVMRLVIDKGGLNVDQISLTSFDDDKVWYGDFVGLNLNALAGYTSVTGDLSIEGEWKSWPDFYCSGGEELTTLKIPSLNYVGGDLIIRCVGFRPELTEHGFDNLSRIGGSLKIIGIDGFPLHLREELRDQVLSRDGIGGDIIIEP